MIETAVKSSRAPTGSLESTVALLDTMHKREKQSQAILHFRQVLKGTELSISSIRFLFGRMRQSRLLVLFARTAYPNNIVVDFPLGRR